MKKSVMILLTVLLIIALVFLGIIIYQTIDLLKYDRCYNLPINEMFQNPKCKKYINY